MKYALYIIISLFLLSLGACAPKDKNVVCYVNPMIGATVGPDSDGKTFPGVCTPFGMVQLSPDTETSGDTGPGYSYYHSTIEGFSFTHMSGVGWYGDFGNLLITPTVGELHTAKGDSLYPENGYRSRFSHQSERAEPGYYAVRLDDYDIFTELSAMPHSGIMRITYPLADTSRIQFDLARRIGGTATEQYFKVVDEHTIMGWMHCTPSGGGWGHGDGNVGYTLYFYAQLSLPLINYGMWKANLPDGIDRRGGYAVNQPEYQDYIASASVTRNVNEASGKHIGFFAEFPTEEGTQLILKCGISFVDIEGARKNLSAEIPGWDFDKVVVSNRALWQKELSSIQVEGGTEFDKTVLYTALYHSMIDPRCVSDVDGRYQDASGKIQQTSSYKYRTIFSGWDVFRSQMPLFTLISPDIVNDEICSLVNLAEKSGREYFPRWEIMNSYSGCMIGNPAVSVLCDAYTKGIRNYDVERAYHYAVNTVEKFGNGERGYTVSGTGLSETLEYCYTDWCVSVMADSLGKKEDMEKYATRAHSYIRSWDADEVHWFRAHKGDGMWADWHGITDFGHSCAESNPYQQGWFVPHDIRGMATLMGGRDSCLSHLNAFFEKTPQNFRWNSYYNHANEPVHHVPYLFSVLGRPDLTQYWTRTICRNAYGDGVDGLCGNEDVGQMSAWYILSAIGLHPICPGDGKYYITSPIFSEITINIGETYYKGKSFTVRAYDNSPENIYIQSATFNGEPYNKNYLTHRDIVNGGVLCLHMGNKPSDWGKK